MKHLRPGTKLRILTGSSYNKTGEYLQNLTGTYELKVLFDTRGVPYDWDEVEVIPTEDEPYWWKHSKRPDPNWPFTPQLEVQRALRDAKAFC